MWDSKRDTELKNRLLDSEREGEGGMIWENGTVHVYYIACPGLMHETGSSGPVPWEDPEGWDGVEGGRGVQDLAHMYTRSWFMSMYGKTTTIL